MYNEYLKLKANDKNLTHIKLSLSYDKGGETWSGRNIERGYYLTVKPVIYKNSNGIISETFTAFSGIRQCIKVVNRQSKKAEAEAITSIDSCKDSLIDYVCQKNNIELECGIND